MPKYKGRMLSEKRIGKLVKRICAGLIRDTISEFAWPLKIIYNLSHITRCRGQYSNLTSPEYMSEVLKVQRN